MLFLTFLAGIIMKKLHNQLVLILNKLKDLFYLQCLSEPEIKKQPT